MIFKNMFAPLLLCLTVFHTQLAEVSTIDLKGQHMVWGLTNVPALVVVRELTIVAATHMWGGSETITIM